MLTLTFVLLTASLATGHCADSIPQGIDSQHLLATEAGLGVSHGRSLHAAASGIKACAWDGGQCILRKDFVRELPGVFGSANTESARLLADAALRAAVCSNFTGKPQCLAAPSYSCDWDTALNRCTLAEVLNYTMLSGVAFCPGSPLDQAFRCAAETTTTTAGGGGGGSSCTSSPHNCTLVDGLGPLDGAASSLAGSLGAGGDRLASSVMASLMASMAKYGMSGMTGPAATLSQLIAAVSQALSGNSTASVQVCAAAWMTDAGVMSRLGQQFSNAVQVNTNLLTALFNTDLAGSCTNGTATLPLLAAAAACGNASASAAACAAAAGCRWAPASSGGSGSCTVGPDVLPRLVLDPSDRWVQVLDNATALCRTLLNETSCVASTARLNVTVDATIVLESAADQAGGGSAAVRGGDGGAAAAASVSWRLMAAAAAMALGAAAGRRL